MLTKDLIRCRLDRDRVRPRFVDPADPALLDLAERLLQVYRTRPAPTRGELEEMTEPLLSGCPDPVLARGLNKTLADRCAFEDGGETDAPALRRAVFAASGAVLRAGPPAREDAYRAAVLGQAAPGRQDIESALYADLPDNERLASFRDLNARQLLERYNVGLVQALLLRASALDLWVSSPDPAPMRRLLKYLRFFRLLTRLTLAEDAPGAGPPGVRAIHAHIDGPTSLFAEAVRYGLQLASFFPAVCALETWKLEAVIDWRDHPRRLCLDQSCGLACPYRNLSAYVPEEVRLFHEHFRRTVTSWRITGETPFLPAGGQDIIFPDLSFRRADGFLCHLELFHRWHARPLHDRLDWVKRHPELPLILGVDQALARDPATAAALEGNACFQSRGFLFRDYPTVEKTLACLNRAAEARPDSG